MSLKEFLSEELKLEPNSFTPTKLTELEECFYFPIGRQGISRDKLQLLITDYYEGMGFKRYEMSPCTIRFKDDRQRVGVVMTFFYGRLYINVSRIEKEA